MATAPAPNPRASLLSGLRTGGVRSAPGPATAIPQTAAPGGSFSIPRYMQTQEEEDELSDMMMQNMYINNQTSRFQQPPRTAAVDGGANRFAQQQTPGNNINYQSTAQNIQALQLQMMQMELQRLQALQAQQFQAELLAQAQAQAQMQARHRQSQQNLRRNLSGFAPPTSAGPMQTGFDVRMAAANAQMRKTSQADQPRAQLGVATEEQVPMTAALGGRFGSRVASGRYDEEDEFSSRPAATPNHTTVISGGTSLGSPITTTFNGVTQPSKSDAAVSWRRGSANNSVLGGNRAVTSPLVKITPPPIEPSTPTVGTTRNRPSPLTLNPASLPFSPRVAIDMSDSKDGDESSSVSSKSDSSPSTPHTASSSSDMLPPPLSPREEATKKLYEGLGIGRPAPNTISIAVPQQETPIVVQRFVSHPMRQPRGPPSNNDELLPKNFASRSRRQAIGALLGAAERRGIEAC